MNSGLIFELTRSTLYPTQDHLLLSSAAYAAARPQLTSGTCVQGEIQHSITKRSAWSRGLGSMIPPRLCPKSLQLVSNGQALEDPRVSDAIAILKSIESDDFVLR